MQTDCPVALLVRRGTRLFARNELYALECVRERDGAVYFESYGVNIY